MNRIVALFFLLGITGISGCSGCDRTPPPPSGVIRASDLQNNDVTQISKAIAQGANVNHQDAKGVTPLMVATRHNAVDAARLLIDKGADVNAQHVNSGMTALMLACSSEKLSPMAQLLLERGADPNIATPGKITALWIAVNSNLVEVVKWLLAKGANPNVQPTEGVTALMAAERQGFNEMAALLRQYGAQ